MRIAPAGIELLSAETTAREHWLDQRLATLSSQERQTLTHAAHIITTLVCGAENDAGDHQRRESSIWHPPRTPHPPPGVSDERCKR